LTGIARGAAQPGRTWSRRFNHPFTPRKSPPQRFVPIVGANQTAPWALVQAAFGSTPGYRGYNPPQDGVPSSYPGPGVQIPAGVPASGQVVSIKPDLTSVLNGSLDATLATFFASMPAGAYVSLWHEAEINNIGTQAQVIAMHTRAYGIFNANAPAACSYGQIVAVQSGFVGHSGYPLSAWMCSPANGGALLDFYGMDNAPQNATITYADNINTCIAQMVAGGVPANGPWSICENGYHSTWAPQSQAQWYADGWAVAQAIGAIHYMSFFSPTAPNAYVLWPAPSTDVLRVLQDISAVARGDPRSPPAAAIALTGTAPLAASASATTLTSTFSVNPAAGSKMLVAVQAPSGATLAVSDNGTTPATFVLDSACLNASGAIPSVWVFRADNITLPGAGSYAVTVTQTSAGTLQLIPRAYTGVQNGPPSSSSAVTGTGNNPAVNVVTPDDTASLFFSTFFCNSANSPESMCVASPEFTLQQAQTGSGGFPGAVADALVTSPAPRQGGFTLPDSPNWSMVMASYGAIPVNIQLVPGPEMVWAQTPVPVVQVTVNAGLASASGAAQPINRGIIAGLASASGWAAVNAPVTATNASAGLASASAAAGVPLATVLPTAGLSVAAGAGLAPASLDVDTAGLASATGSALPPVATVLVTGGLAASTGTAQVPTGTAGAQAGVAATTGTSLGPSSLDTDTAGVASATGVAMAPVAAVSPTAGLASATGAANAPAVSGSFTVGLSAATGTALGPVATELAQAGLSAATGTAPAPTSIDTDTAGLASATGTALTPTAAELVQAGLASASGAVLAATVTTSGTTTANAGLAQATGVSLAPASLDTDAAGLASATGAALVPTTSLGISAGLASATGAGVAPSSIDADTAGLASSTGAALTPAVTVVVNAGLATASGTALAASVSTLVSASAGLAQAAAAAVVALASLFGSAGLSTSTGAAKPSVASLSANAGVASATGAPLTSVANVTPTAGLASASGAALPVAHGAGVPAAASTGVALGPVVTVTVTAGLASASGAAATASVSTAVIAGLASASGWAAVNAPPGSVSALAGLAQASGSVLFVPGSTVSLTLTAINPVGAVGVALQSLGGLSGTPGASAGTGAALDATVTTSGTTFANAGLALASGAASAAVAEADTGTAATASGTALAASVSTSVQPAAGLASGSAQIVVPLAAPNVGLAGGTGTAQIAHLTIVANAGAASATGTALNATVTTSSTTSAPAGLASASGGAQIAAALATPSVGLASGSGTAQIVHPTIVVSAGVASATGAARSGIVTPARQPQNLGGSEVDANLLGGTATVLTSITVYGTTYTSTYVQLSDVSGTATVVQNILGGTTAIIDPFTSTAIGWTMQEVDIHLAEFNDETLNLAITSGGSAQNLTGIELDMFLKTKAGVLDTDPSTIKLSTVTGEISITNPTGGLVTAAIPAMDLLGIGIGFYRVDLVVSGKRNTAIYGIVSITPL
jgi:hypothetical protein